jgi:hypothetical protein
MTSDHKIKLLTTSRGWGEGGSSVSLLYLPELSSPNKTDCQDIAEQITEIDD